jgi:hypothetical protein
MSAGFTDAQLAAFMAGTLEDEALIDAIEAAINADPALAEQAEALAVGDGLAPLVRDAFAPVLEAPIPERLSAALAVRQAEVVDLARARAAKSAVLPTPANDTGRSSWRWPQFGAMAASLALGVLIGGPLLKGGGAGAPEGGSLVLASADLTAMLDSAPSGQKTDLAALGEGEVVLTFRNADGQLCRQFLIEGKGGTTSDALACAGGGAEKDWQIEAYGRRAAPVGEMKLAGGDAAPAVVAAVDAMIDSDPVTGPDELAELGKK